MNPLYLKIAGPLAMLAAVFWFGWEFRDRSADAELLQKDAVISQMQVQAAQAARLASEQARETERLTAERIALAAEADALRNQEREVVERVITNEVIRYVQNPAVNRVVLPADWVRIHDSAALGYRPGLSDAPGPTGRAYAATTDADALAAVTGNYGTCHAIRDQLIGLQEWVRSLQ